jgi:hypothetical protein
VTKTRTYWGTGANDYTGEKYHRNFRGQLRGIEPFYGNAGSESAIGPFTVQDVNWAGNVTATALYDTNLSNWNTVISDDVYASTEETNRRTLETASYDDLGRVYRRETYEVSASTGAAGKRFVNDTFYDRNSRVVLTGMMHAVYTEQAFDGAGRQYQRRTVVAPGSPYSSGAYQYRNPKPKPNLADMSGGTPPDDYVYELTHHVYDASGNVIETHSFERVHNETPSEGIDFTNDDDYIWRSVFFWHDGADRLTTVADYGSGDTASGAGEWKYVDAATRPARPGTAPSASDDTKLVTRYDPADYENDGQPTTVTDPTGKKTRTFSDDLGRTKFVSRNHDNFAFDRSGTGDGTDPSKDTVMELEYNGLNAVTKQIALDPNGDGTRTDQQITTHLYEDAHDASLVTNTIYPDSSDTGSGGNDQVKYQYDLDGALKQRKDQLGTVRDFEYDDRRQLELDKATTLGSTSIDGSVRSIKREYDADMGRLLKVTSYQYSDFRWHRHHPEPDRLRV